MDPPPPGRRTVVVGTSGSGKTTLARRLADRLGVRCVELDALNWLPGWTERPREEFRRRVREVVAGERWVIDGNYSRVRDIVWPQADTVVWLDYPLPVVLRRLLDRSVRRIVDRRLLWGTNRESFRQTFLSRDSILWWALKTWPRRRREYPAILARPAHGHLTTVRLRTPAETRTWLASVTPTCARDPGRG